MERNEEKRRFLIPTTIKYKNHRNVDHFVYRNRHMPDKCLLPVGGPGHVHVHSVQAFEQ